MGRKRGTQKWDGKSEVAQSSFQPSRKASTRPFCLRSRTLDLSKTSSGGRESIRLCWVTDECDEKDDPLLVFQTMGKSSHEKSNLVKTVKSLGYPAPDEDFDVRSLLGTNALVDIEHNVKDGKTYANIVTLTKLPKGQRKVEIPSGWVAPRIQKGNHGHDV
jgi:hypothetical protein